MTGARLTRRRLLEHLAAREGRSASAGELAGELALGADGREHLLRMLGEMEEERLLVRRNGRWSTPSGGARVAGRLIRHPSGYGFVRRADGDGDDIHIRRGDMVGRMHGEEVEVRLLRTDRRGPVGVIKKVLQAGPTRTTGVLEVRGRVAGVVPYDARVAQFVRVRDAAGAESGMAVGVEIAQAPDEDGTAGGRVVEVLGYPDEPGIDVEIIIRKYDLRREWPDDVRQEVDALGGDVDPEGRTDFTGLPTVTIDGETAKDFDDAISVQETGQGSYRLHVHIADVAHYVPEGGPTDREARARGTSVYFPGTVVPMLPERLSNDLCSLRPRRHRLVQSVILDIAADGSVRQVGFADGVIRSRERMTYTDVAGILQGSDAPSMERYADLVEDFRRMESLCRLLWARRRERGSIDFDLPEPEIILNARGEMTGVFPAQRNIAHRMIEEFMLAANEAVADFLFRRAVPSLYRVHERPDEVRVEMLDETLSGLGYRLPRPLDALQPQHFQELVDLVSGRPEERFVVQMVLRAMMQARYDPTNLGHFGLAAERYTHFTSPIRRYPDLVVHRALRAFRHGELASEGPAADLLRRGLPEVARSSSQTERIAEEAERELEEWKKLGFMSDKVGDEYHGYVSGVMSFGLFIQLEEYYVEGLVHVSSLTDRFRFDERRHLLMGERSGVVYRLGDRLKVRVVKVDLFRKQMDLEPTEAPSPRPPGGRRRRRRRGRAV